MERGARRERSKRVGRVRRVGLLIFKQEMTLSFATRNLQGNFRCEALKAAFKQKLVPRVTRVAHVPRRS